MTPLAYAAGACEVAFNVAGIAVILWLVFSAAGRRRHERRLSAWAISGLDFGCFLCSGFAVCAVASGIGGFFISHSKPGIDAGTIWNTVLVDGGFLAGLLGFQALYAMREPPAPAPAVPARPFRTGLAAFVASLPLVLAATLGSEYLLRVLGLPLEKQTVVDDFEAMHSVPLQVFFIALAVTVVPAAEEVLFRGGLFRYFRTRMPRWAAILATSLLFGAAHVGWGSHLAGLVSLIPLVVLAVVLCMAYEWTGTIGTAIVAHSLFNLNNTLLILAGVAQ
jgi:membrane protease YdiL (CAAX protease family)